MRWSNDTSSIIRNSDKKQIPVFNSRVWVMEEDF